MDPRRARRLAARIEAHAARDDSAPVVWTSSLARCVATGRWLRARGWRHHVDDRLAELDFGAWDGIAWNAIPRWEIDAWVEDFLHYRPGGGESLARLLARVRSVLAENPAAVLLTHGGWLSAAQWIRSGSGVPDPLRWPRAPAYGASILL